MTLTVPGSTPVLAVYIYICIYIYIYVRINICTYNDDDDDVDDDDDHDADDEDVCDLHDDVGHGKMMMTPMMRVVSCCC